MYLNYETIKFEILENIAIICLDRPESYNSLNAKMGKELLEIAYECDSNQEIRVIILTGSGDKAFCSGGDLKSFNESKNVGKHLKMVTHDLHGAITKFSRMNSPLIVAVNGVAAGAGLSFVGFADNAYVNPVALPDDGIGFSHLEDTTSIQFVSRKNGAGVSFTVLEAGSTFVQLDSTVATQSATVYGMPDNSVRLGFLFQPAGSEPSVTADQFKIFINGTVSGTLAATTVPDDLLMELKAFSESKGTVANDLFVDYVQTVQQR